LSSFNFNNLRSQQHNRQDPPPTIHPARPDQTHADVKYHLGQTGQLTVLPPSGAAPATLQLSIAPNPSHLEAVCPIVLGMVRADQARRRAAGGRRDDAGWAAARAAVMGLLIHGDAAFSGLGLTAETLQLSDLPGYATGGSVHVIINNQVRGGRVGGCLGEGWFLCVRSLSQG